MEESSNKVFLTPIVSNFFDEISQLRRAGEFLVQYDNLHDQDILNRFDDGTSRIYELKEEILKPVKFQKIGDELLITYHSYYANETFNLGRVKKAGTNILLNEMHTTSNPVLALIIRGGRYKYVNHNENNTPVISVGEDPYNIEIMAIKSSAAAFDGQDTFSSTGLSLIKSGNLIQCPNCAHVLKGERFCRYCELQIKYPGETDSLDKMIATGDSLEKAGKSMSKAGNSMTLGCTIPILLIIIIAILMGLL